MGRDKFAMGYEERIKCGSQALKVVHDAFAAAVVKGFFPAIRNHLPLKGSAWGKEKAYAPDKMLQEQQQQLQWQKRHNV